MEGCSLTGPGVSKQQQLQRGGVNVFQSEGGQAFYLASFLDTPSGRIAQEGAAECTTSKFSRCDPPCDPPCNTGNPTGGSGVSVPPLPFRTPSAAPRVREEARRLPSMPPLPLIARRSGGGSFYPDSHGGSGIATLDTTNPGNPPGPPKPVALEN